MTILTQHDTNAAILSRQVCPRLQSFLREQPLGRVHVDPEISADCLTVRGTIQAATDDAGQNLLSHHLSRAIDAIQVPKDATDRPRPFTIATDVTSDLDDRGRLQVIAEVVLTIPLEANDHGRIY